MYSICPDENYYGKSMLEFGCQGFRMNNIKRKLSLKSRTVKEYFDSIVKSYVSG